MLLKKKNIWLALVQRCSLYKSFTIKVPTDHRHAVLLDVKAEFTVLSEDAESKRIELNAKALVDTGASCSFMSKRIAQALHLKYYKMSYVRSTQGTVVTPMYRADLLIQNEMSFSNWLVSEFIGGSDFDFIIGMDILTQGDFALTSENGEMYFSFRIPSAEKHIDFQ